MTSHPCLKHTECELDGVIIWRIGGKCLARQSFCSIVSMIRGSIWTLTLSRTMILREGTRCIRGQPIDQPINNIVLGVVSCLDSSTRKIAASSIGGQNTVSITSSHIAMVPSRTTDRGISHRSPHRLELKQGLVENTSSSAFT